MTAKWMMGGGWPVQLALGLWLLMGQGALAEPLQRRIAAGMAEAWRSQKTRYQALAPLLKATVYTQVI